MSMNRICLVGRVATDPELRYLPSGVAVAHFRIAVRDVYRKTEDGQYAADFFDVDAWRERAEYVSNYLSKGLLVAVQGRLTTREWTAQDGTKRRAYSVVADHIENYGRTAPAEGGARPEPGAEPPATTRDAPEEYHADPFADE
jgi:single-strand DNA-binding protein